MEFFVKLKLAGQSVTIPPTSGHSQLWIYGIGHRPQNTVLGARGPVFAKVSSAAHIFHLWPIFLPAASGSPPPPEPPPLWPSSGHNNVTEDVTSSL